MTEEEAKTKWCPMVRAEGNYESEQACNRYRTGIPQDGTLCIASKCMWWVWEERVFRTDIDRFMEEGETINADEIPHEMRPYPSSGHCGAVK